MQSNVVFEGAYVSVCPCDPVIIESVAIPNRLSFDPATNTYTYNQVDSNSPVSPQPRSVFPASDKIGSTGSFDVRRHVYNGELAPAYNQEELWIFIPGSANTTLALSYVSYGIRILWSTSSPIEDRYHFLFGVNTPASDLPVSGTASYTGIADGAFTDGAARYTISGTSALSADFTANTITASLNLIGVAEVGGATPFTAVSYSGTGGLDRTRSGIDQYHGTLTSTGNPGYTGSFRGGFFGPAANEYGFLFTFSRGTKSSSNPSGGAGVGVAVGKR